MLIITILGIGMIVGLTTLRNAVVQELADTGAAINNVNQSYSYSAVVGHDSSTAGSQFLDLVDFCDDGDVSGGGADCVLIAGQAATPEGD